MILCKNCGEELRDGARFCVKCGAQVRRMPEIGQPDADVIQPKVAFDFNDVESDEMQQQIADMQAELRKIPPRQDSDAVPAESLAAQPSSSGNITEAGQPSPKKPSNKKLVIAIVIVVVVLIGLMVAGIIVMSNLRHRQENKRKIINVNDYVEVSVYGYESEGMAEAYIDYYDFDRAISNALSKSVTAAYPDAAYDIYNALQLKVTPDTGLSNGDRIAVELRYDEDVLEDYGVTLDFESFDVEVEGLDRVRSVDIFDYVYIEYRGMDGNVWVNYKNTSTEPGLDEVLFAIDNGYNLGIGDEFTLTVYSEYVDILLDDYDILLENTSKTYTVGADDVDHYISSISDISEELYAVMDEYALKKIHDTYISYWGIYLTEVEFCGMYLLNPNENNLYSENHAIMIYIGRVVFDDEDRDSILIYLPVEVDDLVQHVDQTQSCDEWVYLWDDGNYDGDSMFSGFLGEEEMFTSILNEENLMNYEYEISDGLRDYYEEPVEDR